MSLFVAAQTAFVEFAGKRIKIVKGSTIVREGHEILKGHEHLFERLHIHFDVDKPKPAPTPPPVKAVQAKPAAAAVVATEPDEEE